MGPYLTKSGQMRLLTTISIYSLRGERREQIRLLYMNSAAIRVWKEMGKAPTSLVRKFDRLTQLSSPLASLSAARYRSNQLFVFFRCFRTYTLTNGRIGEIRPLFSGVYEAVFFMPL